MSRRQQNATDELLGIALYFAERLSFDISDHGHAVCAVGYDDASQFLDAVIEYREAHGLEIPEALQHQKRVRNLGRLVR